MYLDTDTKYLNVSIDTILDTFLFTTAYFYAVVRIFHSLFKLVFYISIFYHVLE